MKQVILLLSLLGALLLVSSGNVVFTEMKLASGLHVVVDKLAPLHSAEVRCGVLAATGEHLHAHLAGAGQLRAVHRLARLLDSCLVEESEQSLSVPTF